MAEHSRAGQRQEPKPEPPRLLPTHRDQELDKLLAVERADNPMPNGTLGAIGQAAHVTGPEYFDETILVQPLERRTSGGIDLSSVRGFRWDPRAKTLIAVWNSGINVALGYVWTRIRRPGIYIPIGLPRDRLLQESLRTLASARRSIDSDLQKDHLELTQRTLRPLLEIPLEALQQLREYMARVEIQTSVEGLPFMDLEMGMGGHPRGFLLPGGLKLEQLRKRLQTLEVPPGGLPEEQLFTPPTAPRNGEPPWNTSPNAGPWRGVDWRTLNPLDIWKHSAIVDHLLPPWLFSQDWWMYQHDIRHTGHASGLSDITASTVSGLYLHSTTAVDGPVITKASIVDGKIYIGSGKWGGSGGTLYKIDLSTGAVEHSLPTSGMAHYSWFSGIGGSPAVVGDRVYFTGVHGTVYCVDANTFVPVWSVSLKLADAAHNQPVTNPEADSWSGPLVVNGKVYVGCGEGESTPYGFVYCLDASTGNVIWCFCTCKFVGGSDNQPNHIPAATAAPWAAAHGFTVQANPSETGCSVWSSCAYDSVHNCIFVGTGNSQYPHTAQPDELYGSGLISLDADTGAFRGFFQPAPDDSYWPGDSDIDVPGAPSVYSIGPQRVVAFGSKNGSFFVLDAGNVNSVIARRQLLPRTGGSGLPGDRGTGIAAVVPTGGTGENKYGVMGTPAIHGSLGRIFVGIGGYDGMALDAGAGIDQTRTPFLRALNWDDLHDAWPTALGSDGVVRYTNTKPPMYSSREVGLSSPAVVSDVVFVSTDKPGLYALSANDGHCLWSAGGISTTGFALGPTVYGNYVVLGVGSNVYIYKLGPRFRFPIPPIYRKPWPWEIVEGPIRVLPDPPIGPWPGPDPLPIQRRNVQRTRARTKAQRKPTRKRK
jgi:outer membrane protein assembly factor BamB